MRSGSFDHVPLTCAAGTDFAQAVTPGAGSRYYLLAARAGTIEGALGHGRPASVSRQPALNRAMSATFEQTACILCSRNCGLRVTTDGGRITSVRGDESHPVSKGYLCQKAARLQQLPAVGAAEVVALSSAAVEGERAAAVPLPDRDEASRDVGERFVPADAHEAAVGLASQRVLQPVVAKAPDDRPACHVVCLFVGKEHRRKGISKALIDGAAKWAKQRGARLLDACPVEPREGPMPDAFVWQGLASSFRACGFVETARRSPTRPYVRRELR